MEIALTSHLAPQSFSGLAEATMHLEGYYINTQPGLEKLRSLKAGSQNDTTHWVIVLCWPCVHARHNLNPIPAFPCITFMHQVAQSLPRTL